MWLFYLRFSGTDFPRSGSSIVMCFRGDGIGHTSTRAETDAFKTDHDDLDIQSQQDRNDASQAHTEEEEESGDEEMNRNELPSFDIEMIIEGAQEEVDHEGELLEWELMDYGYEPEIESDEDSDDEEEEDSREAGEEDVREAGEEEDY
jgi:hypothetical protein